MGNSYDQKNKIHDKYKAELKNKDEQIFQLQEKIDKLEAANDELRKKLYEAGEGKGNRNRLEKIITNQKRENKTLENKIRDLDGSKLISSFSEERQELISRIKKLSFKNKSYDYMAMKFKNGLDNVIHIAYLINNNSADDMDYYTFVFRDDIVGLLEKMLKAVLAKYEDSASKYLTKLIDGQYHLPKDYYERIPNLKNKDVVTNILNLINLQTICYHGSSTKGKHLKTNHETNEKEHPNRFFNMDNDKQLLAIFTLLEFMYDVFTNKDWEINLLDISANWFKTI